MGKERGNRNLAGRKQPMAATWLGQPPLTPSLLRKPGSEIAYSAVITGPELEARQVNQTETQYCGF